MCIKVRLVTFQLGSEDNISGEVTAIGSCTRCTRIQMQKKGMFLGVSKSRKMGEKGIQIAMIRVLAM